MSELSKQALKVDNNQSFPNNNAGLITPSALRTFNENMIDSTVNQATYTADSASFDSRINAITGSGGTTNTGSLLTTASFDNNTRNLTFTKGDSSTFAVNIPDASGSVLPSGVVSGSSQIDYPFISNIPSGIVSGSSQVSYTGLSNIPAGIVSGSSQIILQDTTGLLSGSRIDGAVTSSLTSSLSNQALDVVVNVKNSTGAQINKGTIVRIIGATGDNPLIQTASWDNDGSSANTLGWVLANIPNGDFGKVVTQGTLLGVNTDPALGYAAGQVLYLSSSGQYTNVIPPAPYHEVRLGQVLRAQQNNGSVFVLIQNGYELGELHDVNITTSSLVNNDVLAYNASSSQWTNQTLSSLGVATFPYVGNAVITGSLIVSSSGQSVTLYASNLGQNSGVVINGRLDVNGQFTSQNFNAAGIETNFISSNATPQVFFNNSIVMRPTFGPVKLEVSGSTILSGSFSASLQEGYAWVGDTTGFSKQVPTSSFAGGGGTGNGFPFSGSAVITGSLSVSETVETQILLTPQILTGPLNVPSGYNGMLTGPVSNSGIITIASGSTLVII